MLQLLYGLAGGVYGLDLEAAFSGVRPVVAVLPEKDPRKGVENSAFSGGVRAGNGRNVAEIYDPLLCSFEVLERQGNKFYRSLLCTL